MTEHYQKWTFKNFTRMHEMAGRIQTVLANDGYIVSSAVFNAEIAAWQNTVTDKSGNVLGAIAAKNMGAGGEFFVVSEKMGRLQALPFNWRKLLADSTINHSFRARVQKPDFDEILARNRLTY